LIYCKVPLRGLLVLTVLVLAYVLIGVVPASAVPTTLDIAVVRGTNNGVYWNSYNSLGSWGSWASLAGATLSPPGICEEAGGIVYVVVRGMDNGIYVKAWSSGSGWSASWASPPGGGRTMDQPACAYLNGLFIVVRGMNNELYWTWSNGMTWSGWVDLHGKSASAPVLVSIPSLNRIDLVVQGTDNGIYHKFFPSPPGGVWSSSWDSPGGKTSSKPAVTLRTIVTGCPSCAEFDYLILVVRGTDNSVYWSALHPLSEVPSWAVWISLGGATLSAPTLAYYENSCSPGSTVNCNSIAALAVRDTDNAVYHRTLSFSGWSLGWDSPGGSTANSPALAYSSGSGSYTQFLLLVEGYPSSNLYSNTVTYTVNSVWGTYSSVAGGRTISDPALVAIV
jgi:hypothetical protein